MQANIGNNIEFRGQLEAQLQSQLQAQFQAQLQARVQPQPQPNRRHSVRFLPRTFSVLLTQKSVKSRTVGISASDIRRAKRAEAKAEKKARAIAAKQAVVRAEKNLADAEKDLIKLEAELNKSSFKLDIMALEEYIRKNDQDIFTSMVCNLDAEFESIETMKKSVPNQEDFKTLFNGQNQVDAQGVRQSLLKLLAVIKFFKGKYPTDILNAEQIAEAKQAIIEAKQAVIEAKH